MLLSVALGLVTTGCGKHDAAAAAPDNAKLSAELETRAEEIESKADRAAAAAEAEAADALAQVQATSKSSPAPQAAADVASSAAPAR